MRGRSDDPETTDEKGAPRGAGDPALTGDLLDIGKIVKTWGLKGHVKLYSYAESPDIFKRIRELYIRKGNRPVLLPVEEVRAHQGQVLLKFRGRDRIEEVEDLLQETLYMHKRELEPLEPGEYYWFQLIGMEVRTDTGTELGTLREIMSTGSNDVYVVRRGDREWLIPATREVVLEVDVNENRMTIHPLEGMMGEHDC